jgi:hypothetical protein
MWLSVTAEEGRKAATVREKTGWKPILHYALDVSAVEREPGVQNVYLTLAFIAGVTGRGPM